MRGQADTDLFAEFGVDPAAEPEREGPPTYVHQMYGGEPENYWQVPEYVGRKMLKTLANSGAIVTKGMRDLGVNVAALPFELGELAGQEWAGDVAEGIRETVPDIELRSRSPVAEGAANVASELIQYGVPGVAGAKGATALTKAIPGLAPKASTTVGPAVARGTARGGIQAAGAAAADFAAAGEEETQTLGNLIGGPTAVQPGDEPLERRAKIGVEALGLYSALAPFVGLVKWVAGSPVEESLKALRALGLKESEAKSIRNQMLKEAATNGPRTAAARLAATLDEVEGGGYQPTSGTASGDPGLISVEKGLATTGQVGPVNPAAEMTQRAQQNRAAFSGQVREATERAEPPQAAREHFEAEREAQLAPLREEEAATRQRGEARVLEAEEGTVQAEARLGASEEELARARSEADDLYGEFATMGQREELAPRSAAINKTVMDDLAQRTREKNRLAQQVDPDGTVRVDDAKLRAEVDDLKRAGPRETPIWNVLPPEAREALGHLVPKLKKGKPAPPLTLRALHKQRGIITDAIMATAKDKGHVSRALRQVRDVMDSYIDDVAEAGGEAGKRAKEFQRYLKEEFYPRFGDETVGGEFRAAKKKGKPIPPEDAAPRFITTGPGREVRAQNLKTIAEGAKNPAEAAQRIREYVVHEFANWAVKGGRVNRRAINRFLDQHHATLNQHPDIKAEIQAMARRGRETVGRVETAAAAKRGAQAEVRAARTGEQQAKGALQRDVEAAQRKIAQTDKEYKKSLAGMFVDADPVEAMGRIVRGQLPDEKITELLKRTQGSPEAQEGLRAALGEHVLQTVLKGDEEASVFLSQLQRLLKKPRVVAALRKGLGEDGLKTLQRVKKQMGVSARIDQKATAGSPTAPLTAAQDMLTLALDLRFGIMRGRRYMNALKKAPAFLHKEESLRDRVLRKLVEAYKDPDEMMKALTSPDDKKALEDIGRWMGEISRTRTGGQLLSVEPREE